MMTGTIHPTKEVARKTKRAEEARDDAITKLTEAANKLKQEPMEIDIAVEAYAAIISYFESRNAVLALQMAATFPVDTQKKLLI